MKSINKRGTYSNKFVTKPINNKKTSKLINYIFGIFSPNYFFFQHYTKDNK